MENTEYTELLIEILKPETDPGERIIALGKALVLDEPVRDVMFMFFRLLVYHTALNQAKEFVEGVVASSKRLSR